MGASSKGKIFSDLTASILGCSSHKDLVKSNWLHLRSFFVLVIQIQYILEVCGEFQKLHEAAHPIKQTLFREVGFTYVDLIQRGSTQFNLNFHLSVWIWLLYYPHSTITPFVSSLSTFKLLHSNIFLKYLDIKILSYTHFQLQLFRLKCHHSACFLDNTTVYKCSAWEEQKNTFIFLFILS